MASHPETRRAASFVLWGSVLAAIVLAGLSIRYFTRERIGVYTARVSYQNLDRTTPTNGKVELINEFQPHAQSPGVVEDIYVSVNDQVKPGMLLLKMDDADARARLASAQSALKAAQLAASDIAQGGTQDERTTFAGDLRRARLLQQQDATSLAAFKKLQQQGDASPAEVSAAQQRLEMDDSNLHSIEQHSTQRYGDADRARAQAQLADAQAAVAAAQSAVANANIRSPIKGTVYAIPVSQYDYVAAGSDLIYVADLNRIQVTAYFDEPDVGNLAAGQPVKIVWDAKPAMVWRGHISIAPTTIVNYQNTRNVGECEITIDDARADPKDPNSLLQPNANVTVTVTTAQHLHVLSVPREALHTEQGQTYVFRIIKDRLVRTPVKVDIVNPTRAEITGGLAEGDAVALNATVNHELTDGLQVTPIQ
jgi:HlyD family secretion protein